MDIYDRNQKDTFQDYVDLLDSEDNDYVLRLWVSGLPFFQRTKWEKFAKFAQNETTV